MKTILEENKAFIFVFFLCFLYWTYLFFSSSMAIVFDAIGYQNLGEMIYKKGWAEFFRQGPNREPLYPGLVAASMRIADIFSISYHYVQKIIQVIFLFISQLLMIALMNKLKVDKPIQLGTILYFGFSPAIVGSTFSLFSEIAAVPFVLAMVIFLLLSWKAVHDSHPKHAVGLAFLTTGACILTVATKSIFIVVFLACLVPFIYVAIYSFYHNVRKDFLNAILYVTVSFFLLTACTVSYMFMNKKYNGHFQINDRNTSILLGSAYKRSNPLTFRTILVHLATIPGNKVCPRFFTDQECYNADWYGSDFYRVAALDLLKDLPPEDQDSGILHLTMEKIIGHPFQFMFFMMIEGAKMPFWESTQMGFVLYPKMLVDFFGNIWFKNGLRLCLALLTIFSLIFLVLNIYRNKFLLFDYSQQGQKMQASLFIALIIFTFTGMYSLCYVLIRYSVPINSLYLISIAYCVQDLKERQKNGIDAKKRER